VLTLSLVLALPAVVQAAGRLPDGVPDLSNPRVLASWQPYLLGNLKGDPDLPLVVYLNMSGSAPAAVLLAIDARNGLDSWSLASDPVIAIAVFADPQTLTRLFYDVGFAEGGQPSGQYVEIAHPDSTDLSTLLRRVLHLQHRVYM
jgi:hypothetical protein